MGPKHKIFFVLILAIGLCLGFYQGARALGSVSSSSKEEAKIDLGPAADFPAGTVKAVAGAQIIVFSDQEGIYAISSKCTHMGCAVNFQKDPGQFLCPCHGAKYDKQGAVLRGPAKADLFWFTVAQDSQGRLSVDKAKTVPRGTKFNFNKQSS